MPKALVLNALPALQDDAERDIPNPVDSKDLKRADVLQREINSVQLLESPHQSSSGQSARR